MSNTILLYTSIILQIFGGLLPFLLIFYVFSKIAKIGTKGNTVPGNQLLQKVNTLANDENAPEIVERKRKIYILLSILIAIIYIPISIFISTLYLFTELPILFGIIALIVVTHKFLKYENMSYLFNSKAKNIQYKYPPGISYSIYISSAVVSILIFCIIFYFSFDYLQFGSNLFIYVPVLALILCIISFRYFVNGVELLDYCYVDAEGVTHNVFQKTFFTQFSGYGPIFRKFGTFLIWFSFIGLIIAGTIGVIANMGHGRFLFFGKGIKPRKASIQKNTSWSLT